MGERFNSLPIAVRQIHSVLRDGGASGEGKVAGAANVLGAVIARIMRFPPAGDYDLHVDFAECDGSERWTREFGVHTFTSTLTKEGERLVERFGPLRFEFDLPGDARSLEMKMRRWSAWRIPLPLVLAPRSDAREWDAEARFWFDVPISLPLVGRIVHYRGWLSPNPTATMTC